MKYLSMDTHIIQPIRDNNKLATQNFLERIFQGEVY